MNAKGLDKINGCKIYWAYKYEGDAFCIRALKIKILLDKTRWEPLFLILANFVYTNVKRWLNHALCIFVCM